MISKEESVKNVSFVTPGVEALVIGRGHIGNSCISISFILTNGVKD